MKAIYNFKNKKDRIEHMAAMVSYRFLSEVEKHCDRNNISRKDLAKMVSTSASYITQLFRGDRQVNTSIIARFEDALGISFTIKVLVKKKRK